MVLPVSKEDVQKHLRDLGYTNITDIQLDEFMKDLKRLIKYEERKSRLESIKNLNKSTRSTSSSSSAYSSSSSRAGTPSEDDGSSSIHLVRGHKRVRQRKVFQYSKGNTSVALEHTRDDQIDAASATMHSSGSTLTSSTVSSRSEAEIRVRVHVSPENRDRQRSQSMVPFGTKPTTSFIRPPIEAPVAKGIKRDPVKLHQYYQSYWNKFRVPGDEGQGHKDTRWAVREWMMGQKD